MDMTATLEKMVSWRVWVAAQPMRWTELGLFAGRNEDEAIQAARQQFPQYASAKMMARKLGSGWLRLRRKLAR